MGDSDGCARVVLWEDDVGKMKEGQSYNLKVMIVKSYRGENHLSVGNHGEIVTEEDIGDNIIEGDLEEKGIVVESEIDRVMHSVEYEGCLGCSAKVLGDDKVAAECTKCGTFMMNSKCKKLQMGRVVVTSGDGKAHTL